MRRVILLMLCVCILSANTVLAKNNEEQYLAKPYRLIKKDMKIKAKLVQDVYDEDVLVLKKYTVLVFKIAEYDQKNRRVRYEVQPVEGLNHSLYKFECLDCEVQLRPDQRITALHGGAFTISGATTGLGLFLVSLEPVADAWISTAAVGTVFLAASVPMWLIALSLRNNTKDILGVNTRRGLRLKLVKE
ncbi:MAG: hypothetical protein LW817_05130 [Candidatus Caenarcaniphilales bacterium]|jgi:hypothetical protein|nr:hypothetical protein [Candidatus Caenarcaniphilales bacterium]